MHLRKMYSVFEARSCQDFAKFKPAVMKEIRELEANVMFAYSRGGSSIRRRGYNSKLTFV